MKNTILKYLVVILNKTGLYDFLRWILFILDDQWGWLRKIQKLRLADPSALDVRDCPQNKKKVLIYHTFVTMSFMSLEHFIYLALRIKGHHPVSVCYDGFLPIAYNGESLKKKGFSFRRFTSMVHSYYKSFGIRPTGMSEYLNKEHAFEKADSIQKGISNEELPEYVYESIPIGKLCLLILHNKTRGVFRLNSTDKINTFRKYLVNAIMSVDLECAIIKKENPDTVVLFNGRLVDSAFMYQVCQKLKVHTVTWEMGFDWSSVVFAHNSYANHYMISSRVWDTHKKKPLREDEENAVDKYFNAWQSGKAVHAIYQRDENDFNIINRSLGLDPLLKTISLFPNLLWESSNRELDVAFENMLEWVFYTIDFVTKYSEYQLIIRAHPAENFDHPDWKTKMTVPQLINEKYPDLISRIKIIEGASKFSSYEMAKNSDFILLYGSTLGPELTLMGLKPIICGSCYYRDRGFTNDVSSKSQFESILLGKEPLIQPDIKLAKKFMYLFLFCLFKKIEILRGKHKFLIYKYFYEVDSFSNYPEKYPLLNGIVDAIINRTDFVE